jgi:DNA-binding IclR family transcriptional regulator
MDNAPVNLPADLRAFLYSCIESVGQVEALIRLRMAGKPASVRELAPNLGLPPAVVRRDLESLTARGLLRADVGDEVSYRYAPASPDLARFADLVATHYAGNREAIVRFISARAARTFADAFKIRKEP